MKNPPAKPQQRCNMSSLRTQILHSWFGPNRGDFRHHKLSHVPTEQEVITSSRKMTCVARKFTSDIKELGLLCDLIGIQKYAIYYLNEILSNKNKKPLFIIFSAWAKSL